MRYKKESQNCGIKSHNSIFFLFHGGNGLHEYIFQVPQNLAGTSSISEKVPQMVSEISSFFFITYSSLPTDHF